MAGKRILSPRPGTFYRRPDPEQPPCKEDGDSLAVGDVVAPIEVMKSFHEVKADTKSIRLDTDPAKKSRERVEYIVVHEMVHLLVRDHGDRFTTPMDHYLPIWRLVRQTPNEAPLAHTSWAH